LEVFHAFFVVVTNLSGFLLGMAIEKKSSTAGKRSQARITALLLLEHQ